MSVVVGARNLVDECVMGRLLELLEWTVVMAMVMIIVIGDW